MCNDSYLRTFSATRKDIIDQCVNGGVLSDTDEAAEYAADYQQVMAIYPMNGERKPIQISMIN